ncbi:MAG: hypothetical protein IJF80_06340 [Clostridia bacterium]|nr:hypothetical protein [Clostridia bacterium]
MAETVGYPVLISAMRACVPRFALGLIRTGRPLKTSHCDVFPKQSLGAASNPDYFT